jgi:hypothetical protein
MKKGRVLSARRTKRRKTVKSKRGREMQQDKTLSQTNKPQKSPGSGEET